MTIESQPKVSIEPQAVMEFIKTRRSIRRYKPDAIPPEYVEMILEAGRWAPNGEDMQPWRFVVVDDKETILKLGVLGARGSGSHFLVEFLTGHLDKRPEFQGLPPEKRDRVFHRLWSGGLSGFVGDAALVIVCCHTINYGADNCMDLSAATMNMSLMAHALGLGACWVPLGGKGIRGQRMLQEMLNLPDSIAPFWVLAMGFPAETRRPGFRKPLSEIVWWNKYGKSYPFPSMASGQAKGES